MGVPRHLGRELFGQQADAYAHGRPGYPAALFQVLQARAGDRRGPAFEIGAGSGQASGALIQAGFAPLTAIEPDPVLAGRLAQALAGAQARGLLDIQHTPFEQARLAEAGFAFGCAATAFHWLDEASALPAVRRALRPGGTWAMWWNVFGDPQAPDAFQQASHALFATLDAPAAATQPRRLPHALDQQARLDALDQAGFTDLAVQRWDWTHAQSAGDAMALTATFSQVAALPAPARQAFLQRIGALVQDRFGGRVERRFATLLYLGRAP